MIARMKGILTHTKEGVKTFNNVVQTDKQNQPIMERKAFFIDTDDESPEPIKVNYKEEHRAALDKLKMQPCVVELEVGRMGKYTFYRLLGIEAA